MAESQLRALAAEITKLADSFASSLEEKGLPEASFSVDSPMKHDGITSEMFMTRQTLCDKLSDMWYLVQGPSESIYNYVHNVVPDAACLNVLKHFNFWAAVPVEGSASYSEIAERVSLPIDVATRVIQHATTLRLFEEVSASHVKHTSRSAALARQPGLQALVSSVLDITGAPMMAMTSALEKYSKGKSELAQDLSETAFALFHSTGPFGKKYTNSWEYLENDGEGERRGWRQAKFVEFMQYLNEIFRIESIVADAYEWQGAGKSTVVDVGGSAGHDMILLARKFPDLKMIVQDMPMVKPVFEANLPDDVRDRVSFVAHDMYQPQNTQADIYMLKLILHDYSEKEAAKILKTLTPALRPGNRVLVIEYIGKVDEGIDDVDAKKDALPLSIRQMGTATDLRMMAMFNAKERPAESYRGIFKAADERYDVVNIKADPLTFFAVIEAVWRG
ncbi:sterigmatocystin 8-O-methyltransferase [Xylaria bambusicola]|uniref:sterigmatocystin 8-O-methyltransferase n=1 Tax=Xylaria bambusicola TaxID=326684 RepID=UPI002007B74E|nr:sterigmatocystin 8-O-methyltransferase [Xylaria bambusicola]KAI0509760.1 sterigmatocystin 8-O-methyltransferase [Xylaria bambusicola]